MHLDTLISLVKDYRPVTARNYGLCISVSLNFSYLGQNGAYIAHFRTPKRPILIDV